jgi:hypothetical protein
VRPAASVKLFTVTADEITGLLTTPAAGISTSFVEIGTTFGVQLVLVVHAALVPPFQTSVFVTVIVADAVRPVPPFVDDTVSVVFSLAPTVVPRTRTVKLHVVAAGIVAPLIDTLVAAARGANVPVAQELVAVGTASTSIPAGKVSVTPTPVKATVLPAGFVIAIVIVEKPLF